MLLKQNQRTRGWDDHNGLDGFLVFPRGICLATSKIQKVALGELTLDRSLEVTLVTKRQSYVMLCVCLIRESWIQISLLS